MHYGDLVKSASSIKEAENILKEIYEESPDYWPNGLSSKHFDGGLYLIREASTKDPVGFVGWQERDEGINKIGYYSIGVQKQHRRKGFAKEAVNKIISEKSAGVDIVRALIVEKNKPSMGLADSLDENVQIKKASIDFTPGQRTLYMSLLAGLVGGTHAPGGVWDPDRALITGGAGLALGGGVGYASEIAGRAWDKFIGEENVEEEDGSDPYRWYYHGDGDGSEAENWEYLDEDDERVLEKRRLAEKEASRNDLGKEIGDLYKSLVIKSASMEKKSNALLQWLLTRGAAGPTAARIGLGAGAGYGVGHVENKKYGFDESGAGGINKLLNMVSFGLGGAWKSLKPFGLWPLKTGGIWGGDMWGDQMKKQEALVKLKLQAAQLESDAAGKSMWSDIQKLPTWAKVLGGAGLTGLAGSAIYSNIKKDSPDLEIATGKPGVINLEIPEKKISDDFYRSISRDLLFKNKALNAKRNKQDADTADDERQERLALEDNY